MKLQYEKPMMAIEYYELTQSIAACGTVVPSMDSNCILQSTLPEGTKSLAMNGYFLDGYCTKSSDDVESEDSLCYHGQMSLAFIS